MKKSMKSAPETIDDYLNELPSDVKPVLEKIRQTIRSVVPNVEETISYGMPAFRYHGMLVYFAAFKNHCSFFPGSSSIAKLKDELKPYQTSKGTLQFTVNKPLPVSLVKKIVKARVQENEAKLVAKAVKKSSSKKTKPAKATDEEEVEAYMKRLKHPLKKEIEAVREVIKKADKNIKERIKWNSPSYYSKSDMVTFHVKSTQRVHLVFHHPAIVEIKSSLLEGDYKDRRMAYFKDMEFIKANTQELTRIMKALVKKAIKN